jgi:membrane-associated phospholipid phosphatase
MDDEQGEEGNNMGEALTQGTKAEPKKSRFSEAIAFLRDKQSIPYITLPVFYVALLLVAYLRYGIVLDFALGVAFLIVVPAIAYLAKSNDFLKYSMLCIVFLLTYEALKEVIGLAVSGSSIISLDSIDRMMFGFNFTAAVQNAFDSSTMTLITTILYSTHIYLVIIAMVLFWFTSRRIYKGYLFSMIFTSYAALVVFALFPTAPPWYSGVANDLLNSGNTMLPNAVNSVQQVFISMSDKVAAFPSLHAAYVTLFSFYTVKLNRKLGLVTVPLLFGVLFSTIYLGQHYVIDLIAGIALSMLVVFIVEKMIIGSYGKEFLRKHFHLK